jgi:outer membrane protein assembly factor BamB
MYRKWILSGLLTAACVTVAAQAGDWPQFRGPNGTGISEETQLPSEWSTTKNVAWKAKLPGYGWSSPIIWGDKVFVTTAVSDKQTKPRSFGGFGPGRGFRPGGGAPEGKQDSKDKKDSKQPERPRRPPGGFDRMGRNAKPPDAVYRWEVYCLNRADGKVLWHQTAHEGKPTIPAQMGNTYASETPVTDGERLYAYFGMTGVFCFDLDGKQLWKKNLGSFRMAMGWGTGSSPALDGDRLFIQCDNEEKSFLVALNKKTGDELWRVDRPEKSSWSTPFVWRTKKRTEVVACGGKHLRSYDVATGKVLWEMGDLEGQANATPVAGDELLFLGVGGMRGNRPLVAVKAGASGDITLKDGQESNAGVAWYRKQAGPSMASPLVHDGYLYVLEQRGGMLSCYNAKTGEPAYKRERLPEARGFTSSPWAYDGKIFCLADDGKTFVIQAGATFKLLGSNSINEMCWSSPAAARGALFLRGVDHLYCIKK